MKALKDLFLEELADMYDAERRISKASIKMAKTATCSSLKEAINTLVKETEGQLQKLERIFQSFNKPAKGRKCQATVGILDEGAAVARQLKGSPAINAALILVVQKLKHHEIASYDCLREWASLLGQNEASALLNQLGNEERSTTDLFAKLAKSKCNPQAMIATVEKAARKPARRRVGTPAPVKLPSSRGRKRSV